MGFRIRALTVKNRPCPEVGHFWCILGSRICHDRPLYGPDDKGYGFTLGVLRQRPKSLGFYMHVHRKTYPLAGHPGGPVVLDSVISEGVQWWL